MVVVVLRDEEGLVDDPHRHLQARMEAGADDLLLAELLEPGHVLRALGPEALEDVRDRALVVTRLVRLLVREVRRGQRGGAGERLLEAGEPERLEVEQVACVLLQGPFSFLLGAASGLLA